jgi:sulfhydrogenase subunit alpha
MKRELNINHLTRVEGHGAVTITFSSRGLKRVTLKFTEGPRFFEFIVKERLYTEIPKIVSRICGICYVSHRLASCFAVEDAFKAKVDRGITLLRELLTVGEFIESHSLHLYFLALPDYMGYGSALEMFKDYPNVVKRGFKLKELGNRIMRLIAGKSVHGENVVPGGFEELPPKERLEELLKELYSALEDVEATFFLFDSLNYPDFESPCQLEMALSTYSPFEFTDSVSLSDGSSFKKGEYEMFVREEPSEKSTAKVSTVKGSSFLIGPLARVNGLLRKGKLRREIKELLSRAKNTFPTRNSHLANLARAVELCEAVYRGVEVLRELLSDYPESPKVNLEPKEGTGFGVKEAPRGTLYHRYTFNSAGRCVGANIVTPTAQLQSVIEEDLVKLISPMLSEPDEEIKKMAEVLVRAYDP